jgi:hypothetical protein
MKQLAGAKGLMQPRLLAEKAWMMPQIILLRFEVQKHGRFAPKQTLEVPDQSVHKHLSVNR